MLLLVPVLVDQRVRQLPHLKVLVLQFLPQLLRVRGEIIKRRIPLPGVITIFRQGAPIRRPPEGRRAGVSAETLADRSVLTTSPDEARLDRGVLRTLNNIADSLRNSQQMFSNRAIKFPPEYQGRRRAISYLKIEEEDCHRVRPPPS